MAADKSPAFQFYPKDFLTDGKVAAMTLEQRGAYITLLSICWLEGSLPDDLRPLARMVGVPLSEFRRIWVALAPCFTVKGDALIHKRLDKERAKQEAFRQMQSERGKLGGRPKAVALPESGLTGSEADTIAGESSSISDLRTAVLKNPLPPKGGRVTREDRKRATEIRRQRFGECRHEEPCADWTACEALIARELAERRAS